MWTQISDVLMYIKYKKLQLNESNQISLYTLITFLMKQAKMISSGELTQ